MDRTHTKASAPKLPVRLLIAEACLTQPVGEPTIRHTDIGEEVTVTHDDGRAITGSGRAFYLNVADDLTRGLLTADDAVKLRVAHAAKARVLEIERRRARDQAAEPTIQAKAIAAAVAEAVAAALVKRDVQASAQMTLRP